MKWSFLLLLANLFLTGAKNLNESRTLIVHAKTDHNFRKQFARSKLAQHIPPETQGNYNNFLSGNSITEKAKEIIQPEGPGGGKGYRGHEVASTLRREASFREPGVPPKLARGSAISKNCNSRCSAKTPCNKRCQLARDKYQLELAKAKYKKDNVKQYTTAQLNQRYYSGQVKSGSCNSRCKAAKTLYEKQRIQYMKTFHEHCQNGHIKNTGSYKGKALSNQGNPSGDSPGDKTTVGSYGGVAKGRPLGAPGAGQINWPNSAKYNWRTACKSLGVPPIISRPNIQ